MQRRLWVCCHSSAGSQVFDLGWYLGLPTCESDSSAWHRSPLQRAQIDGYRARSSAADSRHPGAAWGPSSFDSDGMPSEAK
jgi:hypothetical protein